MLRRAGEGEAGACGQAGCWRQAGGKVTEAEQSGEQDSSPASLLGSLVCPHMPVMLLPWESGLEARTTFIFNGIFQTSLLALATSLCPFFAVFPPVSSRCATANDRSWHHSQPSELESAGAFFSQATH